MVGVVFLPIAERELLVAARKQSTFWVRLVAALVAALIGGGCLLLNELGLWGAGGPTLGKTLFGTLTWLSLGMGLLAGPFFTSDCLSEEKREGTLGFLFLTHVRSFDLLVGKLLATSARGFCAMLAAFPVLALTLLMGGVSGVEFWKTVLALVNALMFSLAAGLFVSALSRESHKAMGATLVLLLLLTAGGPAGDAWLAKWRGGVWTPLLSLASPGYLFIEAGTWAKSRFWLGLLINQVAVWALLGLACLLLPHTWREKRPGAGVSARSWSHRWRYGSPASRARLRRKLLSWDPIAWLACRERWQGTALWVGTVVQVGSFVAIFAPAWRPEVWMLWSPVSGLVVLLLYLGVAAQAGRLFVEARRSGLMELVLATPLGEKRVVQGQWRALLRSFGLPVLVCLVAQFLGEAQVHQLTWNQLAIVAGARPPAPPPPAGTGSVTLLTTTAATVAVKPSPPMAGATASAPTGLATNKTGQAGARPAGRSARFASGDFRAPGLLAALAVSLSTTLAVGASLAALGWFGMLMGLYSKSANMAALKTILFVKVIPWFATNFASAMLVGLLMFSALAKSAGPPAASAVFFWMPLLISALAVLLSLAKDVGFILVSRHWLLSRFRERAAPVTAPISIAVPPVLRRAEMRPQGRAS